ncbi:MAG: CpaF family protein [Acidimicrobiales bacterium]
MSAPEPLVGQVLEEVEDALAALRRRGALRSHDAERVRAAALIDDALERHAGRRTADGLAPLDEAEEYQMRDTVLAQLFGDANPLLDLVADPSVSTAWVMGCDRVFLELTDGAIVPGPPVAGTNEELEALIRRAGLRTSERSFDRVNPRLHTRLPDGTRLHAVNWVSPAPIVVLAAHRHPDWVAEDLVRVKMMDPGVADLLTAAVRAGLTIIASGGAGTGKTTLVRALAAAIPADVAIATVESSFELDLDPERHPLVMAMEARKPNIEGKGEVAMAELASWTMLMRARRLIVGEVIDTEVETMLKLANSGHPTMATVHANSSADAIDKLALLARMSPNRLESDVAYELVGKSVDLIVHLAPNQRGVGGHVASVREVLGFDRGRVDSNEVYRPGADGRAVPGDPLRATTRQRLVTHGYELAAL